MISSHITECDRSADIVLIILQRLCNRLADRLQSCEMDDTFYIFFVEDFVKALSVADVYFIEFLNLFL